MLSRTPDAFNPSKPCLASLSSFEFYCDPSFQKIKDRTRWSWWARDQLVACSSKRFSVNIINICTSTNYQQYQQFLMLSKQSTALQKDSPMSVNIIQQFFICTSFLFFHFLSLFHSNCIWCSIRYCGHVRSWVYFYFKVLVLVLMKQKQRS